MRDTQGTPLLVGQTVAFNCSGEVHVGQIVRLVEGVLDESYEIWERWVKKPLIEVQSKNGLSKVRNPRNLVVIKTMEETS